MWGIPFHAAFIHLFTQRKEFCPFQQPHDFFVSCNHFVTCPPLSWNHGAQVCGTSNGTYTYRQDLPGYQE